MDSSQAGCFPRVFMDFSQGFLNLLCFKSLKSEVLSFIYLIQTLYTFMYKRTWCSVDVEGASNVVFK